MFMVRKMVDEIPHPSPSSPLLFLKGPRYRGGEALSDLNGEWGGVP